MLIGAETIPPENLETDDRSEESLGVTMTQLFSKEIKLSSRFVVMISINMRT
jgi:hypothetical protein